MSKKYHNIFCFIFIILCCAGFFGFEKNSLASEKDLKITEILYNPAGNNNEHSEWIEIYNAGEKYVFQLKKSGKFYKLADFYTCDSYRNGDFNKCVEHSITTDSESEIVLGPKEYLIIATNIEDFKTDYSIRPKILKSSLNLSSSEKAFIKICFKDNDHCSAVEYGKFSDKKEEGYSLEKINFSGDDLEENWQESYILGGTPGYENFTEDDKKPPSIVYSDKIIINELLPKPDPKNDLYKEEFVELYNSSNKPEKLDGWHLKDRAGKNCDLSGKTIPPEGFLVLKNNITEKCTLALNDTQGEFLGLYSPADKDKPVSNASYAGSAKKGKSYSFNGASWRWSQYLTPGEENLFNNLPIVSAKKENKIYVNAFARFSARAGDKDGEKLKFTWNFGDGHKSYLQNARHKYAKTGDYTATLKVSDGNEDVLETYKIKVIKFPKFKISVKELSANPAGLDVKGEYLLIKNESEKKVNLKSWGIATGSKNLYNHPVTKDFILKPGQSKKITKKYSLFALANQKAKIEIRYPNGEVAYKMKYAKDKIADDEIYKKIDSKWAWIAPLTENKLALAKNPTENIPVAAIEHKDTEIQNNLGKYSANPEWQNKKENKIVLASYATNLSLPKNLGSQSRVLGASIARDNETYYAFTIPTTLEKHWAVKFLENILTAINSFANNLFSRF